MDWFIWCIIGLQALLIIAACVAAYITNKRYSDEP